MGAGSDGNQFAGKGGRDLPLAYDFDTDRVRAGGERLNTRRRREQRAGSGGRGGISRFGSLKAACALASRVVGAPFP